MSDAGTFNHLREAVAIERERSDRLFAGFRRGEEEVDQHDIRVREIVKAVPALLDILDRADSLARLCEQMELSYDMEDFRDIKEYRDGALADYFELRKTLTSIPGQEA